MRSAPTVLRPRAALAALLLLAAAGCVPAAPALAPAQPEPLGAAEAESFAVLLRLEDRREFAAEPLEAAAESRSARVRARAALSAGRLRHPSGLPLLLELLQDRDSMVSATAAHALGQLGDTTAVPALATLLAHDRMAQPTVASEAAYALGKLRSAEARGALRDFLARSPLHDPRLTAPVGSALLAIWRYPRAAEADPIRRWLGASDPELRWRATYALVRRPDPTATPLLLRLAADPDTAVRALAVRGLMAPRVDSAGVERGTVIRVLARALSDPSYLVRINAARSLGTFADPAVVEALQPLVGSAEHQLALLAVEALGAIAAPALPALPGLERLLAAESAPLALRQAALEAAARVQPSRGSVLARSHSGAPEWRLRASAARALAVAGEPVAALESFLRDPDPRVRAAAVRAAVAAQGETVQPLRGWLLEALGMEDIMVRAAALEGLGRLRDASLVPVLLDAYGRARHDALNDAALAALNALAAQQRAGAHPARALFARYGRPSDSLLRLRAREHFGDAAERAWGDPLPIETTLPREEYLAAVERWVAPALAGGEPLRAELHTDAGIIVLRLFAADAPLTVASFLRLAESGYFDGQEWPRVVPNFVVQGGDPRGDTSGGPGYVLRDEINRHRYETGALGMALSGPDTGGSQFFITHSPQPHLDGIYTVFGEVVAGQEVTRRILPGDRIHRVRIVP